MADIFVSYKREDAAKVGKLVAALRSAGLDTWWDEDIPPAAPWEATIEKALREAKAVIVCWSPDAVASANVRSEARVAREDGRLIQLLMRPCQPPLFFGEEQRVDLANWRGKPDDPRIAKITETARKVAAGERVKGVEPARKRRFDARIAAVAAALLLLIAGAAGWWFLRPAHETGPETLAVLPFRALNPADANLVDAIWDDTRGAISRNPNLRVLGRQTVEALAARHLEPADYRRRVHADYLLDGSVQHVGDEVRLKLSLVQTKDGSEVWSDQVGGKLDDVFAFQTRIANEVEGRIRGRVAPGGGVTAKNIATSADVYALYSEAKAKIRQRNGPGMKDAITLLNKAVAIDPNYAPAWAELSFATHFTGWRTPEATRRTARIYGQRALTLAPNLAHAYAVLAMAEDLAPETEGQLRRAVALDPNDVEAWMWLGSLLASQNRLNDALQAHRRAVEIEPLWFNSLYNLMDDLRAINDVRGLADEVRRAESTGDSYLILRARSHYGWLTGQPAMQVLNELQTLRQFPDRVRKYEFVQALVQLGFVDEAFRFAANMGPGAAANYRGTPDSPQKLRSLYPKAVDFWADDEVPELYGRLLPKFGRLKEYVGLYKSAFRNVDEFYAAVASPRERYFGLAPNLAVNLRAAGDQAEAEQILQREEAIMAPLLRNGPANWQLAWSLAQLRAAQGRDDEAVAALGRAVAQGWLPDRTHFAVDIAEEPSFARLTKRADFQAIRMGIINRIEEERRKIAPEIANAELGLKQAA